MTQCTIESVEGIACSVSLAAPVQMGLGLALKREAVVVKVRTSDGLVGWGEAHHARAPRAIEALVNTTLRDLVVGRPALETTALWDHVYRNQLATHGMGSAAACALSGLDTALWDIRGQAAGWPLYRMLGGSPRPIPAYAGGVALGYKPPEELVADVEQCLDQGFTAVKLRIGQDPVSDLARVRAVREAVGPGPELLTDANAQYSLADVMRVLPALEELSIGWLEEPFAPQDRRGYADAARWSRIPLAAGENHYTRFEFDELIRSQTVGVLQPDVSKCGGITEIMRIAALAATAGLPVCPHTSITGINMAATVHAIASIPTARYFEADIARGNTLRTELTDVAAHAVSPTGEVRPQEGPGLGIQIDEEFLRAHPLTDGPAFVPTGS